MTLSILDFVLLIILFFFAFGGFFFGLIRTLGSLIGAILGIIIAFNLFEPIAAWLGNPLGLSDNWTRIIVFALIFVLVERLVQLIFWFINKVFKLISVLPFLKTFNRIGGLILGLIEGSLVLGVALVFLVKFPFTGFLISAIENSKLAEWLFGVGTWFLPLLPELFNQVKDLVNF